MILYELLVGVLPLDPQELCSGGFEGIRRRIREEEPKRPSTRLTMLGDRSLESANARRTEVSALGRQLRGDLDWIAMKALEKDRARRHPSAALVAIPPSAGSAAPPAGHRAARASNRRPTLL